jgi:hypothetical protein
MRELMSRQNPDGGWPYCSGASWTEPTVYAMMAAGADDRGAAERGAAWLGRAQRADGGYAPQHQVAESTWVTSLALLLPAEWTGEEARTRALEWLIRLTGRETTPVYRLRQFLLGNERPPDQEFHGWPWFPGTAAWVGPTAMAILALGQAHRRRPSPRLAERVESGRQFLLARMCRSGGWNHGSARALGYDGRPYPETTGMALLALSGTRSPAIDRALDAASRALGECRSMDGQNWLRLGLLAHGRAPADCPPAMPCRTVRDRSLALLVERAAAGRNPFLAP